MTVQSDTLGAELPREPGLSMVSVARGQVCVCVCVCDGHTFAKGPQGEIRPGPSLQEVNGLLESVPALLMGSLRLLKGCRVFW